MQLFASNIATYQVLCPLVMMDITLPRKYQVDKTLCKILFNAQTRMRGFPSRQTAISCVLNRYA
jgi:hypothetical protein